MSAEPLLTGDEEVELAKVIEVGVLAADVLANRAPSLSMPLAADLRFIHERGERARQRFIRANLRLVAKVARQAAARSQLSETDLFQEGCLGLIHAVQKYDWTRNIRFSTYAMFWIRAYIQAATATMLGAMNLSTSRAAQLRAVRGVELELGQELGRPATLSELSARTGRSEEWVAEILGHQVPQFIDLTDPQVTNRLGVPEGFEMVLDAERPGLEMLDHLDAFARSVLELRLGVVNDTAHTYVETARILGVSVGRVRRVEQRALETLRSVCPQSALAHLT